MKLDNILIVDNQKAARILLRAFLVRLGFTVIEEAGESIEAVRLIHSAKEKHPFHAVFIAWHMAEMSGLDLVKTIRQLPGCFNLPLIVLGEELDPVKVEEVYQAGASAYLLRPFTEESLRETVESFLN